MKGKRVKKTRSRAGLSLTTLALVAISAECCSCCSLILILAAYVATELRAPSMVKEGRMDPESLRVNSGPCILRESQVRERDTSIANGQSDLHDERRGQVMVAMKVVRKWIQSITPS